MSNAYSVPLRYNQYVDPIDNDRVRNVMAVKQNRFDSNVGAVNEAIQTFGNVDLIRDQDKEYLLNNLEGVIKTLDNTDNIDFSKSGVGTELITHLSKAIDEEVLTHAGNTSNIRNYQNTVATLKKKSPKDYTIQNDWFATSQAGLSNYLQGNSENLGKLEYTPFVDYNKEIDDNLFKWAKEFGIHPIYKKTTSDDGISFTKEGEELTKNQVKQFLRTKLDSRHTNQIYIDTAYNFQNDSDEDVSAKYKQYHSDYKDSATLRKIGLKNRLKKDGYTQSEIAQKLRPLDEEIALHKTNSEKPNIQRGEALQFLSMESFLDNKASAYSKKEYTKVSPDGNDIRRAELHSKRMAKAAKGSSNTKGTLPQTAPGTIIPILNSTEGKGKKKDSLTKTALGKYDQARDIVVSSIMAADTEFADQYKSLTSRQAKADAIQIKMDEYSTVNIGEDVNPLLSKQMAVYRVELKNLNKINDTYRTKLSPKLDQVYDSMVDELSTKGQDFNYENFRKKHPKTVELLTTKGKDLTQQQRNIIRYELAQDAKNLSGISEDAKNATEEYADFLYNQVKDVEGIEDPNRKSEFRKMISNVGGMFSKAGTILGSGFDEEVIKQENQRYSENEEKFSSKGILEDIGKDFLSHTPIGLVTQGVQFFAPDQKLADLQEEDLQLTVDGKPTRVTEFLDSAYEDVETQINKQLAPSEERFNKAFEIVFSPVTTKTITKEREALANLLASRTGAEIKNSERISMSLDNVNGNATLTEIDNKEGAKTLTIPQNQLPKILTDSFDTKKAEWQFDVRNPNAPETILNYSTFKDKSKASKHFTNLRDKYKVVQENHNISIEDNRRIFAPTQQEIAKSLIQAYPEQDKQVMSQLITTPYQIKMKPDQTRGVYVYEVFNALTGASTGYEAKTKMSVYNEGLAAANSTRYLMEYFKSVLDE